MPNSDQTNYIKGRKGAMIKSYFNQESATGPLLFFSSLIAMVFANSGLSVYYDMLLSMPVEIRVGPLSLGKPLLLWINDGLMAMFFFFVGLELKREVLEGALSDMRTATLPIIGAVGGMAVPALTYAIINWGNPVEVKGWAIPAATDIAFALGVLMLFGKRVPVSMKVFLVSLAIFDDVGAIVIIALFYTEGLSSAALIVAACCIAVLYAFNRGGMTKNMPYLLVGGVMWVAVLKSGVHATLAGVLLAMFIPLKNQGDTSVSPLRLLEADLHGVVNLAVLPIFAFVNAGIPISDLGIENLFHPVAVGVAVGLFIGKQAGVFISCWIAIRMGIARLPEGMSMWNLYGLSILCGIGFTMSLFIGGLAFEKSTVNVIFDERVGIIAGSLASAVVGAIVLHFTLKRV